MKGWQWGFLMWFLGMVGYYVSDKETVMFMLFGIMFLFIGFFDSFVQTEKKNK